VRKKISGVVAQFGTKGYGFIDGDDGEKYFVHQKSIFNKSRLKIDDRVKFFGKKSEKGWVATNVRLESGGSSKELSAAAIKFLFALLFTLQLIAFYKLFY
jgi:CspA family cold shock protein